MKSKTLNYLTYLQSEYPERVFEEEFFLSLFQNPSEIQSLRKTWVNYQNVSDINSLDNLIVLDFGYGPSIKEDKYNVATFPIKEIVSKTIDYLMNLDCFSILEKRCLKETIIQNVQNASFTATVENYYQSYELPPVGKDLLIQETLNIAVQLKPKCIITSASIAKRIQDRISSLSTQVIGINTDKSLSLKDTMKIYLELLLDGNVGLIAYPDLIFDAYHWLKKLSKKDFIVIQPTDLSAVFWESENFVLYNPEKPHLCRQDGGHLLLAWKKHMGMGYDLSASKVDVNLNADACSEYGHILETTKSVMRDVFDLYVVNHQQNGNWTFLRKHKDITKNCKSNNYTRDELLNDVFPKNHTHLLGRSWKSSLLQTPFETVVLPNPGFKYDHFLERLDRRDIFALLEKLRNKVNNKPI